MSTRARIAPFLIVLVILLAGGTVWWVGQIPRSGYSSPDAATDQNPRRVAVEAVPVTTGTIRDVRSFTGTLEPGQAFTLAPKTGGQVERIHVDIGDRVRKGQVVAELADAESRQAVAEAEAMLGVARAELNQARADARLAERELERTRRLAGRDMASASALDTAEAEAQAQEAAVEVARARVKQREAALARARVQLGYMTIRANWPDGDATRVVGQRMVNPGDSVGASEPLLSVLRIAPLTAVIQVPERDYARLTEGQNATLTSRALPGRTFDAAISRIAPRFSPDSRRARVEVRAPNPDRALKPGMFVNVRVIVGEAEDATLIPAEALVRRREEPGVYRIRAHSPATVEFVPVTPGIRNGDRIQIRAPQDLSGRVVTLGQQMLEDGAPVTVAELPES
ncbi:efflux RND transporter periplasmic adaptor subunit [Thiohalorhabdus methylotrophus]|uniref:Efflux RND transporter periplasmic adaptor subunit n=1 Tax=Thiohalorhabdus methylotrophus TaxID=3242694 RepID=A0ABV4TRY1_9GAMM